MAEEIFWAEKVVEEITREKRKEYVCEGGWSPSGYFHIGNSRPEIFTPYAIYKILRDKGFRAKQILVVDDFDPIDKIPTGIPVPKEREKDFLGMPYKFAESPFKGHDSWADYFTSQITDVIDEFGVDVKFISSFESYKSGERNELIKFSLGHAREIVETWNRVAGTDKPLTFLPVTIVCENCRKIMFTEALSWDGKKVSYKCSSCNFESAVSPFNGKAKLHWRVHWAANWIINNVSFESAGKDHFSKGGSVDVGKALMDTVFKKPMPFMVPTEFLQIAGAKMSGSVGNVYGLKEWLEVASPELFRFMFFSYRPNTAIDFSFSDNSFILLNERFERAERIYYGEEKAENEKTEAKIRKSYEMSCVGKPAKKKPLRLPYSFAVQVAQLMNPDKQRREIMAILEQTGHISGKVSKEEEKQLIRELFKARAWADKYAPAEFKISFLQQLSEKEKNSIAASAKKLLPLLAAEIKKLNSADEIQQAIFDLAKSNNVQPKDLFKAVYLSLTGKEAGPRAGMLILALGKEKSIQRLEEAGR